MQMYARVRHAVMREGLSQREAARQFGLDRKTVAKMLAHSIRKRPRKSILGNQLSVLNTEPVVNHERLIYGYISSNSRRTVRILA